MKRNALAAKRTIDAMRHAGQIEVVDAGVVALVRATADSLDAASPGTAAHASCARAHGQALDRLRELTYDDVADGLDDLLGSFGTLGDTAEG